ncbi:MAG: hypothetical protein K6E83_00800 [Clostridium sp.]|nr:hypothetical protein [Clostridium sp.]
MKRILTICAAALIMMVSGCASPGKAAEQTEAQKPEQTAAQTEAQTAAQTEAQTEAPSEGNGIWTAAEMPVSLHYDRMWEYCAVAESTDEELISEIIESIKMLEVGEPTNMAVDDFTDRLTFTFADGSQACVEFEADFWVTDDQERYEVKGLGKLRGLLDELMEEQ